MSKPQTNDWATWAKAAGSVIIIFGFVKACSVIAAKHEPARIESAYPGAAMACQKFLERQIVDKDATFGRRDASVEKRPDGKITVRMNVVAKNAFGAKISTTMECRLADGGDNWKLVSTRQIAP